MAFTFTIYVSPVRPVQVVISFGSSAGIVAIAVFQQSGTV